MNGAPIVLALELSQRIGGVAVRDGGGASHVELLSTSAGHDEDLFMAIDRLYTRLGLAPAETQVVGVSTGPGGFTGLRIAVATAKMLAEALGAKTVAVPTALVVAESYEGPGPIVVALASKQETAWVTRLERDSAGTWTMAGHGALVGAEALDLHAVEALLGDRYLPSPFSERCLDTGVPVVEPAFTPLACLNVAWRLFEAGETTDPLALAPIYPRPPAAVMIWNRDRYRT